MTPLITMQIPARDIELGDLVLGDFRVCAIFRGVISVTLSSAQDEKLILHAGRVLSVRRPDPDADLLRAIKTVAQGATRPRGAEFMLEHARQVAEMVREHDRRRAASVTSPADGEATA